jgi:hypothetical protein
VLYDPTSTHVPDAGMSFYQEVYFTESPSLKELFMQDNPYKTSGTFTLGSGIPISFSDNSCSYYYYSAE